MFAVLGPSDAVVALVVEKTAAAYCSAGTAHPGRSSDDRMFDTVSSGRRSFATET
jgi:hypothetical protein